MIIEQQSLRRRPEHTQEIRIRQNSRWTVHYHTDATSQAWWTANRLNYNSRNLISCPVGEGSKRGLDF